MGVLSPLRYVGTSKRKTLSAMKVAERYQLEREIARGGMGTVWFARDSKLGRPVALKVMAQELAQRSEPLQRFEREARAVAQLRSSHIVEVFDYGVQEGLPFIVMELLEGESLGQRLRRLGRFGLHDSALLVTQICKGLKAAHAAGLVHRDLKPSNIFLTQRDDNEVVKLLDFGVVKAVDTQGTSEDTASGMLLGTPQYMSPEQARANRDIDHRADLWSLAVIVFRMLTGVSPFQGESVGDVVLKICSDDLPRVGDYATDLPADLDAFFDKAFGRKPADRFQSAQELGAAFCAICAQQHPDLMNSMESTVSGGPMAGSPLSSSPGLIHRASLPEVSGQVPQPPSSFNSLPVFEATPIATTVGGTQLASKMQPRYQTAWRSPLAIAVAAGATMIIGGLFAFIWLGTGSSGEGAAPAAKPPVVAPADMGDPAGDDDPGGGPGDNSAAVVDDLDEDEQTDAGAAKAAVNPTARKPLSTKAPKGSGQKGSGQPAAKSDKDRPEWF